jgi:hypothetical protein
MKLGEFWRRLMHFVRGTNASDDLRDEMQLHVELRAKANRSEGMSDADALPAARRGFGNEGAMRETSRDQWGFVWAEHTAADVRYAVRRLIQRPGFAAAVIGVLALGIGATTAMFSAVDAAMLRPLPFADPGRLVALRNIEVPFDPGPGQPHGGDVRNVDIVDGTAPPTLQVDPNLVFTEPERVSMSYVTARKYYQGEGGPPILGGANASRALAQCASAPRLERLFMREW